MDQWDGIIIGAGVAAAVTVVVTQLLAKTPIGGGTPAQPALPAPGGQRGGVLYVVNTPALPMNAAPLKQNTAITESAYSAGPGFAGYTPAFGIDENRETQEEQSEAVMTI